MFFVQRMYKMGNTGAKSENAVNFLCIKSQNPNDYTYKLIYILSYLNYLLICKADIKYVSILFQFFYEVHLSSISFINQTKDFHDIW
jgi:hypothetical protein